ncbi:MAG: DUF5615 family PIN-like protein [Sporichthyaceae bacterium]
MKLAMDHHYSTTIAANLRSRGHDVIAAVERDWHGLGDADLVDACRTESRALLTNNVADFAIIARSLATGGHSHQGLIFTSDTSLPRTLHTIGRYVDLLDAVMQNNPADDALVDTITWLGPHSTTSDD